MNKEQLYDKLAEILNALPDIDPFDDEAWMTDKCFPKFEKFVATLRAEDRISILKTAEEKISGEIYNFVVKHFSSENEKYEFFKWWMKKYPRREENYSIKQEE